MPNDKSYIKLTKTEQLILNSYKKMIVSLGEYLGEGYEIILHSLENLQHSVIENVNGHYSGRKNGAPITDLALSMLSQLKEEPSQPAVCYMNHSKKGVPLRSCTIPITGEKERIIGLICINFYTDVPLSSLLAKFYPFLRKCPLPQRQNKPQQIIPPQKILQIIQMSSLKMFYTKFNIRC